VRIKDLNPDELLNKIHLKLYDKIITHYGKPSIDKQLVDRSRLTYKERILYKIIPIERCWIDYDDEFVDDESLAKDISSDLFKKIKVAMPNIPDNKNIFFYEGIDVSNNKCHVFDSNTLPIMIVINDIDKRCEIEVNIFIER